MFVFNTMFNTIFKNIFVNMFDNTFNIMATPWSNSLVPMSFIRE